MENYESTCRSLIQAGRKIFPLKPNGPDSKEPLHPGFFDCVNQSDDKQLEVMLNAQLKHNTENIGMVVGSASSLVTIDLDFKKHPESLKFYEEHKELLHQGVAVVSGGGRHFHFAHPYLGFDLILSYIGKIDKGVDLLCDVANGNRYVVIPPSVHPDGPAYRYDADDFGLTLADPLPDMPLPLLDLITDQSKWKNKGTGIKAVPADGVTFDRNYYQENPQVMFAVDPFCDEPIEEGGRNNTMASLAGKLLKMHEQDDDYTIIELTADMKEINDKRCDPPLADSEIEQLCTSVLNTNTNAKAQPQPSPAPQAQQQQAQQAQQAPPKLNMSGGISSGVTRVGVAFQGSANLPCPDSQPSPQDDPSMAGVWALHQPPFAPNMKGGDFSLIRIEDQFYLYDKHVWRSVSEQYVESILQTYYPFAKRAHLSNTMNFLKNYLYYPFKSLPFWKEPNNTAGYPTDAKQIIPFNNGLFDVRHYLTTGQAAGSLKPHTENLFNTVKLAYDFDPSATCPNWEQFLKSIWPTPGDERIEALREYAGHLLIPDISQHKIGLIHGVPRGGKSTIGRILFRMIGEDNSCSTDLHSLSSEHGIQMLVGKNLAVMFDAHIPTKQSSDRALEKLKGISGGDPQLINPKFLAPYTVTLTSRLLMICNDVPKLNDGGNALLARILSFRCDRSFQGVEDRSLESKLIKELPGIANWALQGIKQYTTNGGLCQPKEGKQDLLEIKRLLNPVSAFVDDCVDSTNLMADTVAVDDLFRAWNVWADANFISKGSKDKLFSRMMSLIPPIKKVCVGGVTVWHGMKLKDTAAVLKSNGGF